MKVPRRSSLALIAALGVAAATGWAVWGINASSNPVDSATILAGDLAAVTLAVTLLTALGTWWLKGPAKVSEPSLLTAAADRLAAATAYKWRDEAAARRIVTPAPITVRWAWASVDVASPRTDVLALPAAGTGPPPLAGLTEVGQVLGSGVVSRLHDEVYIRLPYGRLVLIGKPGSGKTAAMILLLLAALEYRAGLAVADRIEAPVPVWLTLGRWNPATSTLHAWAEASIIRDYPAVAAAEYGHEAVSRLLQDRRVALFLDGLDEMPEGVRALALRRIDAETRMLRVVLTSRTDEYRNAAVATSPDNTAVIELCPVRAGAAASYLLRDQAGASRERWELLAAHLRREPECVAARTLDNPLALSLARDVFVGRDPIILADQTRFPMGETIYEHLIDQVLVNCYPQDQLADATRGLAWVAHSMGNNRDLQWWDIPTWVPVWKLRMARGLIAGLAAGLASGLYAGIQGGITGGITAGLLSGTGFGLWFGLVARIRVAPSRTTQAPDLKSSLRLTQGLVGLISGYAAGVAPGLLLGLGFTFLNGPLALLAGITCGSGAGLAAGLALGLQAWLQYRHDKPVPILGQKPGLCRKLIAGIASGSAAGFVFAASAAVGGVGLTSALIGGIIAGVVFAGGTILFLGIMFRFAERLMSESDDKRLMSIPWKLQLARKIFAGITVALLFSFAAGLIFALGGQGVAAGISYFLWGVLVLSSILLILILAFEWLARPGTGLEGTPRALEPRLPQRTEIGRFGLTCFLFLPLIPFVLLNLWGTSISSSPSATAASTYRVDRRSSVIYGITCGCYITALLGIPLSIEWRSPLGVVAGLAIGGIGTCVGTGIGGGQFPLIKLAEMVLRREQGGYINYSHLLENALNRQILRQAGVVYQFRHAVLQEHLGAMYLDGTVRRDLPIRTLPNPGIRNELVPERSFFK